jgi:hypothetical protein
MAQRWLVPVAACVLESSACIAADGRYVWLGFTSETGGSAVFYRSGSATAGKQLWTLAAAACSSTPMVGPFNVGGSGVYVDVDAGSAMVALDADV